MLLNINQTLFVIFVSKMNTVGCRFFRQLSVFIRHSRKQITVGHIFAVRNLFYKLIEFFNFLICCTVLLCVRCLFRNRSYRKQIDFRLGLILLCFFYKLCVFVRKGLRTRPVNFIFTEHHKYFLINLCGIKLLYYRA